MDGSARPMEAGAGCRLRASFYDLEAPAAGIVVHTIADDPQSRVAGPNN